MSDRLVEYSIDFWKGSLPAQTIAEAADALETGKVLYLPKLAFQFQEEEKSFLSADIADARSKNVVYDIRKKELKGTSVSSSQKKSLQNLVHRFSDYSRSLVEELLPHYRANLIQGRTSFRPVEALGRASSYRKDDTRLHVDAFPSSPTAGKRILRVFSNVNPSGVPRHWRVGEPFAKVVEQFLPKLSQPNAWVSKFLELTHITRGRRTPYDHYMNQLHNAMKADLHYQKNADQENIYFQPGATWIVYSDQVSHAAMSGQFMFEQTFYLPVEGMVDPQRAPIRVLERAIGKSCL